MLRAEEHRGVYVADHVSPSALAALLRYRGLLANLVIRDIKVRYKRSTIGFGWMLLNPLIVMAIFTIVFSGVFSDQENYSLYVIVGLLAWNLFSLGTAQGTRSLVHNGPLMRKVYLPKVIFPIAAVTSNLINLSLSLVPVLLYMVVLGAPLSRHLLWLPFSILVLYLFTIGVALLVGTLNVFFRDVQFFYEAALTAWFYATPIFYPYEIIPEQWRVVFLLNPMRPIVELFRAPLYRAQTPDALTFLAGTAIAGAVLLLGWRTFHRQEDRFINYV